ncbi:lymphocyte transmembrane adapter 1 [Tenrec ecaudatus]|uniref:lymphocyte transmembrane adapter 1 n=1 Tax=Tenrec ecaudatus TaxID=94439 RepID=UPI003F5AD0F2
MDHITPALSGLERMTVEPNALPVTPGSPDGADNQSPGIFSGFAALLVTLLIIAAVCILWNWNKRKRAPVPYLRVTVTPSLTLPQRRERSKNIYDFLPQRQEEPGNHHARNIRIFSTESLLSRNSDSPTPEHLPSRAGNALQVREAHACPAGYPVDVYDNALVPQMCATLPLSAHYINAHASRDDLSISSEESRDYVNVPKAEEMVENTVSNSPGSLFVLPSAQELDVAENRDARCAAASDCTRCWSAGTSIRDEESSSQTSNDYVNMSELDVGVTQGEQPWMTFQSYRDYENVPAADASGNQLQVGAEMTPFNTDRAGGETDALGSHPQPARQSGGSLVFLDHGAFQTLTEAGTSQMKPEETSSEDNSDYENVLPANLGDRASE